jgi:FkbM family methyltransferase
MNTLRTLLERFSRGRVLRRHLPADLGSAPILVSPDAALSLWKLRTDSDLFDFAREYVQTESVVWDVGANVGLFTIAAAQKAGASGKVLAVEPDIWLAALLRRSAALQPPTSAPIQVIPAAVFDAPTIASFNVAKRGRASNFLSEAGGSTQTGGVRETVSVLTITLDWLLEHGATPNVLKIDVEGAESNVLRGAQRVLAEARPIILIEVYDESRAEVTEMFLRYDYKLYDWDSKPRARIDQACFNTLAIPPGS